MLKTLNQLYRSRLQKGGQGSGRYLAGSKISANTLSYQDRLDYNRLDPLRQKDYLTHRGAGMDHETALQFAEPDVSYAKITK